jgi:hypothetical protein
MGKFRFSMGDTITIVLSDTSMEVPAAGFPPYITQTITTTSLMGLVVFGVTSTSATAPSKADIKAGAGTGTLEAFSFSVTSADTGSETDDLTDTSEAATYVHYFVEEVRNPAFSSDVETLGDGTSFGFDFTAPVLSGVSATPGDGNISVAWSTDEGNGTARAVAVLAGDPAPNGWQVISQLKADDDLAPSSSSVNTIAATGAQTALDLTGLTNGTAYDVWLAHIDAHGNIALTSVTSVTPTA